MRKITCGLKAKPNEQMPGVMHGVEEPLSVGSAISNFGDDCQIW